MQRTEPPKIVEECSLPLTGKAVVHDIVTELGWFHVSAEGLVMQEIAEGVTKDAVEQSDGMPRALFSQISVPCFRPRFIPVECEEGSDGNVSDEISARTRIQTDIARLPAGDTPSLRSTA